MTIAFEETLLAEVGLERPDLIEPATGAFDPLTLQLILDAETFLAAGTLGADWNLIRSATGIDESEFRAIKERWAAQARRRMTHDQRR